MSGRDSESQRDPEGWDDLDWDEGPSAVMAHIARRIEHSLDWPEFVEALEDKARSAWVCAFCGEVSAAVYCDKCRALEASGVDLRKGIDRWAMEKVTLPCPDWYGDEAEEVELYFTENRRVRTAHICYGWDIVCN